MAFLVGVFIVLVFLLLLNMLFSFFSSGSGRDDKDDIYIVNEGKNDKPKINPNVGEVTDYEEVE